MGAFTSGLVRAHAPACWFPLAHAEAISLHPRLSLQGLVDTDITQARTAADHFGGKAFADLSTLMQEVKPKLLAVATRTLGRAEIIQQAAASGVTGIHVEKPLCNSMAELEGLEDLLSSGDVALTFGAIRRHMAPYRAAIDYAAAGQLGRLLDIQVNLGAAPLCWTHPHSIDIILSAATGKLVTEVSAKFNDIEMDDGTTVRNDPILQWAVIRFDDGVTGRIGRVPGSDLILSGQEAALAVEADGHRLRLLATDAGAAYPHWRDWCAPTLPTEPTMQGSFAAIDQLVGFIDGNKSSIEQNCQLRSDILTGQRILFAMLQSNAEGSRPVALDDIDPTWTILGITNGRHA